MKAYSILAFTLSEVEHDAAKIFMRKHNCGVKTKYYEYIFGPTGIGTAVSIRCVHCKKEHDVTDYASW